MPSNRSSWEGTILVFFMTFTVLIGISYSVGVAYRITIPWLAILIVSLLVALGLRMQRGRLQRRRP
jgi:hypothetical protein